MQKIDTYDSNGNLISSIDDRTLEFTKEQRILYVKSQCTNYILENYPDFKQRNAGMNIYAPEENLRIINGVKDSINRCDILEAMITACTTNDQVDLIDWNTPII